MNCRDIEPLLSAERDGVLTSEQHASLDRHVAACPACQQLRARLNEAMTAFQTEAANVAVPDIEEEWLRIRSTLNGKSVKPVKKRPLAPVIWFGAPLAAAAALAFAFFGPQQQTKPVGDSLPISTEIAQAEYVEAGDADASTLVYVDKESGWLVVWATDNDAVTKS
jgi:anti-sigma factor RsiW